MLIVYAHYTHSGHCGEILKNVTSLLDARKTAYEVLDLYEMQWDPIFRGEKECGPDGKAFDNSVRAVQEKVVQEKELVFIYPVWWNSVPAILKGFFDRVLLAGLAFRYTEKGFPEGLLKGRYALVLATAGGPEVYHKLMRGNRVIKVVTKDTLEFCGITCSSVLIGSCRTLDEKKKEEIRKRTTSAMSKFLGE